MSPSHFKPLFFALVCLASCSLAVPCNAQSSAPSTDAAAVRAQYRKGLAELNKNNWQAAESIFAELFQKSPTFDVAGSLGAAEAQLGKHDRAAQHLAFALKNLPPKEGTDITAQMRSALTEELARVGTLRLTVNADSAEIRVDGEARGTYPQLAEVYLIPGSHTVEARAAAASAKRQVQATAGSTATLSLQLKHASTAPAAAAAPPSEAGSMAPVPAPPKAGNDRPNWLPSLVTGGLAVVALGVGTGFTVDALSAKSDGDQKQRDAAQAFDADTPCAAGYGAGSGICSDLEHLQNRRKHSQTGATVSFVLGGVFAAAAVGSYFLWARPQGDGRPTTRVGAWIDNRGGSVLLEGSF